MRKFKPSQILLIALLFAFGVYAWLYIQATSFKVGGVRFYSLFDDAMISMRYARNLADGYGLVWNPGEAPIEGFTNLLWVLLMSIPHRFALSGSQISFLIQLYAAVILGLNIVVVRQITGFFTDNWLVPLLAATMTAFFYPLNTWGLQGMEVSLLVLLINLAVWWVLHNQKQHTFSAGPYFLLAVGMLTRIDMLVPFIVVLGYLLWTEPQHRKQHVLWGGGLMIGTFVGLGLFRYLYFGDWLPNTYYLKVSGVTLFSRVWRGLNNFKEFVWATNWIMFLIPFLLLLLSPDRRLYLLFALFLAQLAYSVYVGGDAWEHQLSSNRFISLGMPLFFAAYCLSLEQIKIRFLAQTQWQNWIQTLSQLILATLAIGGLLSFNAIAKADTFNFNLDRWLLQDDPLFVRGTKRYVEVGLTLNRITTPQATIAVVTAGNIPYYADRPTVDLLGKSDRVIAHSKAHIGWRGYTIYRPGHNKWDYVYSIGELQPDVIAQWWLNFDETLLYMENYIRVVVDGFPFYVLKDSPHIRWELIPESNFGERTSQTRDGE